VAASGAAEAPLALAEARGWRLTMAEPEVRRACLAALADAAAAPALAKFRAGQARAAGAIVALALRQTGNAASPALVARIVGELLGPCPPRAQ